MSTRREFIKTSGFLVVAAGAVPLEFLAAQGAGPYPDPDFRQLDSWIVIREDNTATFYVGKTDLGQGTGTAFRQIMAGELDMPYDKTTVVMGSTDATVDQGGSGGSDALQTDGYPMRRVAAEARRVLLEMASERFGVPAGKVDVVHEQMVFGELSALFPLLASDAYHRGQWKGRPARKFASRRRGCTTRRSRVEVRIFLASNPASLPRYLSSRLLGPHHRTD